MALCPCGSALTYSACCGKYLSNQAIPKTPEALMRSRYTAYSRANIGYIKKTMRGKPLIGFNEVEAKQWAKSVKWIGLEVLNTSQKASDPNTGFVEFIATYKDKGVLKTIHEVSEFKRIDGVWFYSGIFIDP